MTTPGICKGTRNSVMIADLPAMSLRTRPSAAGMPIAEAPSAAASPTVTLR